ncbi:MAG: hypothetical protein VB119_05745 [Candidatus Metalachnospira sp.]|nr:hypothetical protein [Bacteroidaceae bacterium]MEA4972666.1 hypothetical protein [Candidatus Metalachnospira sp.]
MKNFNNLSPSEIKDYLAGLRNEDNRNKFIAVIVMSSVIIGLLVAGIVYLIKCRYDECNCEDWDDEWDEEGCCCDENDCCCTDNDVDKSVKVKKVED